MELLKKSKSHKIEKWQRGSTPRPGCHFHIFPVVEFYHKKLLSLKKNIKIRNKYIKLEQINNCIKYGKCKYCKSSKRANKKQYSKKIIVTYFKKYNG